MKRRLYKVRLFYLLIAAAFISLISCSGRLKLKIDYYPDSHEVKNDFSSQAYLKWKEKLVSPAIGVEAINDTTIIIYTHRGEVFYIDLEDGKVTGNIWQPFREPVAARLRQDNLLFVGGVLDAKLTAFNLENRKIAWKKRKLQINPNSLMLSSDSLVTFNNNYIYKIDKHSGEIINRAANKLNIRDGLKILEGRVAAIDESGALYIYDGNLIPGKIVNLKLAADNKSVVHNSLIAAVDGNGRVAVFDISKNKIVVEKSLGSPVYAPPFYDGESLVIGKSNGEVVSYDGNGVELWIYRGEGLINKPLYSTGNELIVPYARGLIVALNKTSGRELWRHKIDNVIHEICVVKDGIIVTDRRNRIYLLTSEQ